MSGTEQRTVEGDGGGNAGGAGGEGDAEARARALGWRPKEQFTGDPERWLPADQFLQRGYESPGMMRQNLHRLTDEITAVKNQNLELRQRVDESVQVVTDLTGLVRTADKRAYEKARQELLAEREKAVQTGDTDAFNKVDGNLRELEKTAPVEPTRAASDPTKPLPSQPTPPGQQGQPPAEARAFYARNPWYNSGMHNELAREADAIHVGLLTTRKDMNLEQNLAEVERRIQQFFPQMWAAANGRTVMPNGGGDGGAGGGQGNGGGGRRDDVGDVSPSGGGGGGTRRGDRNARNFDNMPAESKQAYTRYAKMLEGKGQPLTKDEWATDYWSQFEEVA